jgi:hypothetical protein
MFFIGREPVVLPFKEGTSIGFKLSVDPKRKGLGKTTSSQLQMWQDRHEEIINPNPSEEEEEKEPFEDMSNEAILKV